MARKHVELFYTTIRQEGSTGATRGKVTAAMALAMGAGDGSVIEWEVSNGDCIGGRVLTKAEVKQHERDAKEARAEAARSRPAAKPKAAPAKPSKPVVKAKPAAPTARPKPKAAKPAPRRATKVQYDSDPPVKKKKKFVVSKR